MICFSRQELQELSGYSRPTKIQTWLRNNGIRFFVGGDGWPRVLRDALVAPTKTLTRSQPNIAALTELQSGKAKKQKERSS